MVRWMKNVRHSGPAFCRRHPLAALGLVVEALWVIWMVAALFAPAYTVEIRPESWPGDVQAQEGVQLAEDGVHVSAPDTSIKLQTGPVALKPGAYLITVNYQPDSTMLSTQVGTVYLRESSMTNLLYAQDVLLDGGHTTVTGRAWVPFAANADEARLDVVTAGQCDFVLQSITLQEQPIYRWVRLLGTLLLFAVLDLVVWQLACGGCSAQARVRRNQKIALALLGISLAASLPFFSDTLRNGDDLPFHLYRLSALAKELAQGEFPVRLFTTTLNGFGYPTPLYYCDIFLYLPAVLYNCMLPLQLCYQIYGVLVSLCTAIVCYGSLRMIRCNEKISLLATTLYLLSGYRLINVFLRAAVGEYTAMVFLPLVVCGLVLLYRTDTPTWRDSVPLAAGMAGLALCHVLSLEMVGLFLILFVLTTLRQTFRKARFVALVRAALLAVGLSAWFLIPMLQSMATQNIQVTARYSYDFQQRGINVMDLFAPLPLNISTLNGNRGEIGLGLILALVVCMGVLWQRKNLKLAQDHTLRVLQYALGFAALSMVFSLYIFPWNALFSHCASTAIHKFLGMIQFPWRYLGIASVLLCVAVAAALQLLQNRGGAVVRKVGTVLLAGTLLYAAAFYSGLEQMQTSTYTVYGDSYEDTMQIGIGKEYILPGEVDYNYARPTQMQDTLLVKWYDKTDGVAHITLENTADTEASVVLPINDYGNYVAEDTAGNRLPLSTSENSLLVLTVPGGYSGAVSVSYREPVLWRIAELISLATVVGLCIGCARGRRKKASQQLAGDLPGKIG